MPPCKPVAKHPLAFGDPELCNRAAVRDIVILEGLTIGLRECPGFRKHWVEIELLAALCRAAAGPYMHIGDGAANTQPGTVSMHPARWTMPVLWDLSDPLSTR